MDHGVRAEQLESWSQIISKLGGPGELQRQLEQYGAMSGLVAAKKKEIENYNGNLAELGAQVKALNEQKVEIQGAIATLSASGVKQITAVGDEAMTGLKSLSASGMKEIAEVSHKAVSGLKSLSASGMDEITQTGCKAVAEVKAVLAEIRVETKRLADLKAESGRFEKELMYARYFTTGDPAVLKSLPREVVFGFLDRAASYCRLNSLDCKARMPDHIYDKYYDRHGVIVWAHPEISLLDLVSWLQAGLAGASQ